MQFDDPNNMVGCLLKGTLLRVSQGNQRQTQETILLRHAWHACSKTCMFVVASSAFCFGGQMESHCLSPAPVDLQAVPGGGGENKNVESAPSCNPMLQGNSSFWMAM